MRPRFINKLHLRRQIATESGIYIPIIAATIVAFLLLIGYALDLGNLSVNRARLQRAVDSAAMSAVFFYDGKNSAYVKDAAEEMARTNLREMGVAFDPSKIVADPDSDGDPATNVLQVQGTLDVPLMLLKYVPGMGLTRAVTAAAFSERN